MRRWLAPLLAFLIPLVLLGGAALGLPSNPGYDGSTTIELNFATPNWLLLYGTGTLHVRQIDLAVIGAQAGSPTDLARWPRQFGCWYAPDPSQPYVNYTPIGFVDFLPEPKVNSTRNDFTLTFPKDLYDTGLPSPQTGEAIVCGWDPKGQGYPDLVGGYGRAHLFYSDSGGS